MLSTTALLALAGSALALPASTPAAAPSTFGGLAIHSTSPIHLQAVSASGSALWIGKPSATYCPSQAGSACNAGTNDTVFAAAPGGTTLSLNVIVPGGQQVYVAQGGRVEYTVPHSADTHGGETEGFAVDEEKVTFKGNDWVACPEDGAWGVYAAAEKEGQDCVGFLWKVVTGAEGEAWEYI